MSLTGVHSDSNGVRHYNPHCKHAPETVRGVSRCCCGGYPATTIQGDCTVCGAGYYETDDDWANAISGGSWAKECQGTGFDSYGNECVGYGNSETPCFACGQRAVKENSGGFVESEGIKVKEMKEVFPCTLTAYRGEKAFKVYGVIEDSIASKVDREGNVTVSFETLQSKDEIGYIPCVDWYTTELES